MHLGVATNGSRLFRAPPPFDALPPAVARLRDRCAGLVREEPERFVQAIVTFYGPHERIEPHVDRLQLYGEPIVAVSLGAPAQLRLEDARCHVDPHDSLGPCYQFTKFDPRSSRHEAAIAALSYNHRGAIPRAEARLGVRRPSSHRVAARG